MKCIEKRCNKRVIDPYTGEVFCREIGALITPTLIPCPLSNQVHEIADLYGFRSQKNQAIEEMSELIQAL